MKKILTPRYRQIFTMLLLLICSGILFYFIISERQSLLGLLKVVANILTPFVLGALIAFLLKPMCNFFDRILGDWFVKKLFRRNIANGRATEWRIRRNASIFSIIIAMLLFLGIVFGILSILIPSVINGIISIIDNVPTYIENMDKWVASLDPQENMFAKYVIDIYESVRKFFEDIYNGDLTKLSNVLQTLQENLDNILSGATVVVSSVVNALVTILVTVVSSFNILYNRKQFGAQANMIVRAVFKKNTADWLVKEVKFADRKFSEFFTGKMLDSAIVGVILFIVFSIIKIPNAALISIFMACCNMIPFFGPFIGAVPCALLVFMSDPMNPINIIYFLIVVIVVQQLDGNILDPYIVGDSIGLSSFWVLFAVIVFGDLFGFVGLLVGVPLFAVIYDIVRQLVGWGLAKREEEQLLTEYNFIYHNPEEERGARKRRVEAIKAARMQARANDEAERREAERCALAIAQAAEQERLELEERLRREEESTDDTTTEGENE